MEHVTDPLLPAFYLLWKAAMDEPLRLTDQDHVNANKGHPNNNNNNRQAKPAHRQQQNHHHRHPDNDTNHWQQNGESPLQMHSQLFQRKSTGPGESVVVCTVECDQGSKFVKQIFHESAQKTVWSSVEDLFVDWLNCELTSQHAERVDVVVYLCRVPVSTTSDGIRLWMENLRLEGKEVNLRIKVASLAPLVPGEDKDSSPEAGRKRKSSMQENETEDTIKSLKHLLQKGAVIEPISMGDWMQLITLLTDRASLQTLDLRRSPCSGILSAVLES